MPQKQLQGIIGTLSWVIGDDPISTMQMKYREEKKLLRVTQAAHGRDRQVHADDHRPNCLPKGLQVQHKAFTQKIPTTVPSASFTAEGEPGESSREIGAGLWGSPTVSAPSGI